MPSSLDKQTTPMMAQWHKCKEKAKDAIVLFQLGDFFEAFYEDAKTLSDVLDLTLTNRQGIPMSGIPSVSLETYVERLVAKGLLVAIADQVEDARKTKGLVKREITRVVSPATHLESSLIKDKANNFFASVTQVNAFYGLALLDLTTGEMLISEFDNEEKLLDELFRAMPSELLVSDTFKAKHEKLVSELKCRINVEDNFLYDHKTCYGRLTTHFDVLSLDGFGLKGMIGPINAAGALFTYLEDYRTQDISHITSIKPISMASFLLVDRVTQSHLEILHSSSQDPKTTLLYLLDNTKTPMGGRLLRKWVSHPLLDLKEIQNRQQAVTQLIEEEKNLPTSLKQIRDLERLAMKVQLGSATPRDLIALADSLSQLPSVKNDLREFTSPKIQAIGSRLLDTSSVVSMIQDALVEVPPLRFHEGGIFKDGYNQNLDELRELKGNSQSWLANYQVALREEFDIKTLRVNFNKAFGYFIEVSRAQSHKMPEKFDRRQTLVNAERYISPELKEYESKIFGAEEKLQELETKLFHDLRDRVAVECPKIIHIAHAIAELDALLSFSLVAREGDYCLPTVDNGDEIIIEGGKHPIIDRHLNEMPFIPNDVALTEKDRLLLLTGPNMAGKSTYIRQVALLTMMAQMGSYIPARCARVGIVDKIFSRIGASDDLSRGQSTFMVEMSETANILHNATSRSLIILDEIGRGTSTYDGLAIAWAVASHILDHIGAKTLFATHYWELTELKETHTGIENYRVAVDEESEDIVFLHKIVKGEADKSYGIHVAKLAGLPPAVISLAKKRLKELEKTPPAEKKKYHQKNEQFYLFPSNSADHSEIIEAISKINLEKTTPIEALNLLADWKNELRS